MGNREQPLHLTTASFDREPGRQEVRYLSFTTDPDAGGNARAGAPGGRAGGGALRSVGRGAPPRSSAVHTDAGRRARGGTAVTDVAT
ncbi:hypothetical protein GCM10023074_65550 [Microbispora amethystogenes]|uniref:Uncharacterized protein n=1 Tax=Microbispora amethystogenes TaxID=1427754 RepID=A0ABQ4FMC0_9ACTN|nr:hypothetical protein Mam01_61320 [Microbispora amethystogenes]